MFSTPTNFFQHFLPLTNFFFWNSSMGAWDGWDHRIFSPLGSCDSSGLLGDMTLVLVRPALPQKGCSCILLEGGGIPFSSPVCNARQYRSRIFSVSCCCRIVLSLHYSFHSKFPLVLQSGFHSQSLNLAKDMDASGGGKRRHVRAGRRLCDSIVARQEKTLVIKRIY
jgi:hypothetical protein